MVIKFDGGVVLNAASEIDDYAEKFKEYYTRMFDDEIGRKLQANEGPGVIWYGQLANDCKNDALARKTNFESMYKDLKELANWLREHNATWTAQQAGGGYRG